MNALNISAQGGHDFHESISSFGQKKIVKCIDELIEYHKLFNDKGYMNKDIDNNFLPSLEDRRKYISDINNYIDEATEYLEECRKCYFNDQVLFTTRRRIGRRRRLVHLRRPMLFGWRVFRRWGDSIARFLLRILSADPLYKVPHIFLALKESRSGHL